MPCIRYNSNDQCKTNARRFTYTCAPIGDQPQILFAKSWSKWCITQCNYCNYWIMHVKKMERLFLSRWCRNCTTTSLYLDLMSPRKIQKATHILPCILSPATVSFNQDWSSPLGKLRHIHKCCLTFQLLIKFLWTNLCLNTLYWWKKIPYL